MDQYLDFEQPIYTRLEKIEELKKAVPPPKNLSKELNRLEVEAEKETKKNIQNIVTMAKSLSSKASQSASHIRLFP